jgi:hypothetical protein
VDNDRYSGEKAETAGDMGTAAARAERAARRADTAGLDTGGMGKTSKKILRGPWGDHGLNSDERFIRDIAMAGETPSRIRRVATRLKLPPSQWLSGVLRAAAQAESRGVASA